ncbi:phosphate ABC transporter membrane protein 2, PhoT family [Sulfurivirga caldicuralii]|uniref:Phosphate transport system permease protein PstA n=1 Tax=Sulfurivirga caldicuralii TaxID=364032 RepID=A0A1N6GDU9_9GAMM|nr:phosphate ABC transporter permease PstA [Sulfurivirga caldicuralii]SIO05592.1 phosphate ABC transporter membrane protein 2, PhoT family [Sulfurivirga caldicuralii]
MNLQNRRLFYNRVFSVLSIGTALLGLIFLGWIIVTLVIKGTEAMSLDLFTTDLINNGLRNLLWGQFVLSILATVLAIPIGMLAGIWLQEYGNHTKFATFIRDLSDVMMSAPSIVIGTFVYAILVVPVGHANGWAGIVALAILMLPIVVRTTDDMLGLIPRELREAGVALGIPKYRIILDIIIRGAKVGIMTGLLLAFARIVGETAPLLYTSGTSQYWTTNLNETFPSLTVSIYNLATHPQEEMVKLGWAGALILAVFVLALNIIGRYLVRKKH